IVIALGVALTLQKGVRSLFRGHLLFVAVASIATLTLFARVARITWLVTQQNETHPTFSTLAAQVDHSLPPNAVLLFDQRQKLEYMMAMFWTRRSAYPLGQSN